MAFAKIRRGIVLALVLWLGVILFHNGVQGAVNMQGSDINISSDKLNLKFHTSGDQLTMQGMSDVDGGEWLTGAEGSLWKVTFRGPDGTDKEIGSDDSAFVGSRTAGDVTELTWKSALGDTAAEVTVSIRTDSGSSISHWSLRAKLPDGWRVTRADFPIIPGIKHRRGLRFAAPAGWGLEYDVKPGVAYEGTYPSCMAGMQFMAFYSHGSGLYIGAHDAQANHKVLSMHATKDGAEAKFINWTAIPEKAGGEYRLPYEAAVGVYSGGYEKAASIYAGFVLEAPWSKSGRLSMRPIPQWLKDTDLWLRPHEGAEQHLEITQKALKYFDVPTSIHWYQWHAIPYDTLYPEYFPPKPGFAEGVKTYQNAGAHVMPYINGRLCDQNSKTWNDESGSQSAARRENGEPYTEVYGSKVPLNVMCPYTSQWQERIAGLVERLTRECGVDGVYIDQIGAAPAVRCLNPAHGHPIGGGHFWVDGYRKLLEQVRAKLPKDRIITTEENAECWIDQFDALLLVNTPTGSAQQIPLFPLVYSGRALTFGFLYFPKDDLERSLPFRTKMARCFVWGSQMGWIEPDKIMAPENAKEAEFLRNLARCRRFGHKFLVYGTLKGLLNPRGDNPHLKGEGSGSFSGTYEIDMPSVLGSSWLAEDKSIGIVLANMSDDSHEVDPGMILPKDSTVEVYGPEGLQSTTKLTESDGYKVTVPARSALILSIHKELP